MTDLTEDTFFNGRISVRQPSNGYRFSIDAVLLGNLAEVGPGGRVIDLGTGCGVIPLILCFRHPGLSRVFGVEIQQDLARIAQTNAEENGLSRQIAIFHRDIRKITPDDTGGPVETVVCNPPHFAEKSGRINPDSQKAVARHEIAMTLYDLMSAAFRMLAPGGKLAVIYPSERLADLLTLMRKSGIEPKQLRMIHPEPGAYALRVLVHGMKGRNPGLKVDPPLYIRREPGVYSDETEALFRP